MIEILNSRELTEKEKKKYEIEQEIKQKQLELERLDSEKDLKDTVEAEAKTVETEDKHKSIESLTPEEEEVVSKAIKADSTKLEMTDEELKELLEKSKAEYESIKADSVFGIKSLSGFAIFVALMIVIYIVTSMFRGNTVNNIDVDTLTPDEITVTIDELQSMNGEPVE